MGMGLSMCLIWYSSPINSESRIKRIMRISRIKSAQPFNPRQSRDPQANVSTRRIQTMKGHLKHGKITEKIIGTRRADFVIEGKVLVELKPLLYRRMCTSLRC